MNLPFPIAVAVSGGADSMALALMAKTWAEEQGNPLVALTVDHGLRKESKQEAEQVAAWMREHGIEHHILTWNPPADLRNKQMAAREARYALITEWCRKRGIPNVMVAHHMDDQAETLLLRLKRGSHIEGLAAMRQVSERGGIRILRPLLGMTKAELVEYLREIGQPWLEDPSNENTAYDRNRLRKLLSGLPNRELTLRRLAASAARLSVLRDAREQETSAFLDEYCANGTSCPASAFTALPQDLGFRVLSALLRQASGEPYAPRFTDLERLYTALTTSTRCKRTLHGCIVEKRKDTIRIYRESP